MLTKLFNKLNINYSIKRLRLKDNDILVLKTNKCLSLNNVEAIRNTLKDMGINNKVLMLDNDMELSILSK